MFNKSGEEERTVNFKCRNFCTEQKYRSVCKEYNIYTESDHIQELLKPNGIFEKIVLQHEMNIKIGQSIFEILNTTYYNRVAWKGLIYEL